MVQHTPRPWVTNYTAPKLTLPSGKSYPVYSSRLDSKRYAPVTTHEYVTVPTCLTERDGPAYSARRGIGTRALYPYGSLTSDEAVKLSLEVADPPAQGKM